MHSSESASAAPASTGAPLLVELGEMIIQSRQYHGKTAADISALKLKAGTSNAVPASGADPKTSRKNYMESNLLDHVDSLWREHIPLCIEALMTPNCRECVARLSRRRGDAPDGLLLLERWTLTLYLKKSHEIPTFITPQWLLNAVRSQLHFSQISAWNAQLIKEEQKQTQGAVDPKERQRRLSRETCNIKKLESNCDQEELYDTPAREPRKINVFYSFKIPGETFKTVNFSRDPNLHVFPITDLGGNVFLKVTLESLPRLDDIPLVRCLCSRRRLSKDLGTHEELAVRMSGLSLGPPEAVQTKDELFEVKSGTLHVQGCSLLDDRMHTPCSEAGKHRCSCDDESDQGKREPVPCSSRTTEDKRFRILMRHRRRMRRESEMRRMRECSLSDSAENTPATSIPILQAARFDRLRTIGYRIQRRDARKEMVSIGTQTEEQCSNCGSTISYQCSECSGKKKREPSLERDAKKQKCDSDIVRKPKLRRVPPILTKLNNILNERLLAQDDINELSLKNDDSVFDLNRRLADSSDSDVSVPSFSEVDGFRMRFESAASMIFHTKTGLPLTSSPAPLRKGKSCFDYDSSITDVSGIKSALFHPIAPAEGSWSPSSSPGGSNPPSPAQIYQSTSPPLLQTKNPKKHRLRLGPSTSLLGSWEESVLKGRLEPVATVAGFSAELGASGSFCPAHRKLPVTVFFYASGDTNASYLGHINLGASGYHVPRSGTIQVSLLNPHGTLVKMFVVLYDLVDMPPSANTFIRQKTMSVSTQGDAQQLPPQLRYLIHLRFMTTKSGKLYLHTDIRIIVSRKADLDNATALTTLGRTTQEQRSQGSFKQTFESDTCNKSNKVEDPARKTSNGVAGLSNNDQSSGDTSKTAVFCSSCGDDCDKYPGNGESLTKRNSCVKDNWDSGESVKVGGKGEALNCDKVASGKFKSKSASCVLRNTVEFSPRPILPSYELRSYTYGPENPKYSTR